MFDLVIIGAGSSGVYLGNLTNNFMNVVILEASDRIGGRVLTKNYNNKKINLGAEYLHFNNLDNDPFGHIIMTQLDKEMKLIPLKGKSWLSYLNCDWFDSNLLLNENFKKNIIKKIVLNNNINNPLNYWEKIIFDRLYFYISNKIKRENQLYKADPDLILEYSTTLELTPLINDSDWYLDGSFEDIIKNLALNSKLNIKFNNLVFEINYINNFYIIKSYEKGKVIEFKSKFIAITVPLGCLKQNFIQFKPDLPSDIKDSIKNIGYGFHNKVIVTLSNSYVSNNNYFIIKNSIIHWSNYHKNVLIGHILGSLDISKEEIITNAMNDLNSMSLKYIGIDVIDWRENDFAGNGSYSYLINLEDNKYVKRFNQSLYDNTMFFCGEAYGLDGFQTVRGAFNSARTVYKKLEKIIHSEEVEFKECFHLNNIIYDFNKFNDLKYCNSCDERLEIWQCLTCKYNGCGRYRNKCSIKHFNLTKHPLVISYPDTNIWCYLCNSYVQYNIKNIDNMKLITNNINNWEKNKKDILENISSMEISTKGLDIIEINKNLKIIYSLRK